MKLKLIHLLLICVIPIIGYTQEDLYLELIKKEPVTNTKKRKQNKNLSSILNYNDSIVAWTTPYLDRANGVADSMFIIFPDGKTFEVEPIHATLISDKAKVIVKFGQKGLHPKTKANTLIFYDFDGNIIKRYDNKHKKIRGATISENGFLLCRSRLIDDESGDIYLFLYDYKGYELYRKKVESRNLQNLGISRNGDYFAYVYESKNYYPSEISQYNIEIFNKQLKPIISIKEKGYIHRLVFSDDNKYLLISGNNYTATIALDKEELMWEKNRTYEVGLFPAVFMPDRNAVIILCNRKFRNSSNQMWEVHILNLSTGEEIFSIPIQDETQAEIYQSLFLIENNQLKITGHNNTYIFQLRQR